MKHNPLSDLSRSLRMSSAGMHAQNKRMLILTQNLANANTQPSEKGGDPYRRKIITFKEVLDPKTGMRFIKPGDVKEDKTPFELVYSPGNPMANSQGYVKKSNVNPLIEMADIQAASRDHQSNVRAYEKSLDMIKETLSLLR